MPDLEDCPYIEAHARRLLDLEDGPYIVLNSIHYIQYSASVLKCFCIFNKQDQILGGRLTWKLGFLGASRVIYRKRLPAIQTRFVQIECQPYHPCMIACSCSETENILFCITMPDLKKIRMV